MNRSALSLLLVLPLAGYVAACGSNDKGGGTGGTGTGTGATGGTTAASGGSGGSSGTTSGTGGSGATTGGSGATTGGSGATGGTTGGTGGSGATGGSSGTKATGGTAGATAGSGGSGATGGSMGGSGSAAGGSPAMGGSAGSGTGGSAAGSGAGGSGGGTPGDYQGVLQHHGDAVRDGLYVDAAFTADAAKNLAVDSSFMATYSSDKVYAQPLYLVGAGGKPDQVFVFTDGNKAYGFDATSGMQTWTKSFGTPLNANPCGSFGDNGGFGITGTPVIDAASRTIYFANASSSGGNTVHQVHAINADTGEELMGWPVNVSMMAKSGSTTFDSSVQKQRAGLQLLNGKVYIGFGGHVGDCGGYHGWLVSIDTATQGVTSWATRAIGGAVWGASGMASDGTSLFFATGNSKAKSSDGPNSSSGDGGGTWGDSETIYKFPATLMPPATSSTTDFFLPMNWVALDDADQDMGGTAPILMDVAGATPSKLLVSLGKDGNAYLVDRTDLGGMDATPIAKLKVSNGQIINAMAGYHTAMGSYVVFKGTGSGCPSGQSGGLTTFKISAASPPTLSMAWCGGGATSTGSPSVTSTDASGANTIVWAVGSDNKLHGVDGDTGKSVVDVATSLGSVATIQVPIVAKGRIFVASSTQVYALKP